LIGAIRGISQTISYEVRLVFLILSVIILIKGFSLEAIDKAQEYIWFGLIIIPVFLS
jgi:NADH:ubiquinone oxidoreductase subunit H